MLNWFRRLMGWHVCEEFTQWETREAESVRSPNPYEFFVSCGMTEKIDIVDRWQERQCTLCGRMQQRKLKW